MIKKFPVRVMKVIKIHTENNCRGEFIATGEYRPTHKPTYFHKCDKCGADMFFDDKYPHYETEK